MKKRFLLIFTVFLVLGYGCSPDEVVSTPSEAPAALSVKEQVAYTNSHLLKLGKAAVVISDDPVFRANLYAHIEEAFDGDNNVLIRDLANTTKSGRAADTFNKSLVTITGSEYQGRKAMEAFKNIGNRNYFPQLFIPFYDELKEKNKIGIEKPVLVTSAEHAESYKGYIFQDGELVETGYTIDEAYARQHEVWVMSINERVDNAGLVKSDYRNMNNARTQGIYAPNARFEWIKCTMHKETWVAGGSEVHIKRYISFYDFEQYDHTPHSKVYSNEDDPGDGDGWRIYEFTRKDVDNKKRINRKWIYMSDWPNQQIVINSNTVAHGTHLYYVIFEYDAWPTALNSIEIRDEEGVGIGIGTYYRSSEIYYQIGYIPEHSADNWEVNEGEGFWALSLH